MPSDHFDSSDLFRLADDGCPHVPDYDSSDCEQ
jgi:hypothetical protein